MSYVSKKTRIFREAGDIEVSLKHSDGRLKSYQSAVDPRAWCDSREDRRQYILELIRQGNGKVSKLCQKNSNFFLEPIGLIYWKIYSHRNYHRYTPCK